MAAGGHFVNLIKNCVLIWNGQKCDRKWFLVIQNTRWWPFCDKLSNKIKVAYWSEMVRNVIESDFWSSKMVTGGHFVKKKCKQIKVAYWSEVVRNAIQSDFRWYKWSPPVIFWNKNKFLSEMARIIYMQVKQRNCCNFSGCLLELTGLLSIWSVWVIH